MESSDDDNLTDTEHSVAAMNKRKTFQSQRTLLVTKQFAADKDLQGRSVLALFIAAS